MQGGWKSNIPPPLSLGGNMSVSIALLGEDFTLVAADDRATFNEPINGQEWHDGERKVFQMPYGFVAASGGIVGVKERFERYLNHCKVKTRKDIWEFFCFASRDCENLLKSFGVHNKKICTAQFIYSLNYFKDGTLHMDIEMLDFMYHTRRLTDKNVLIVNAPKDTKRIRLLKDKYFEQAKSVMNIHEAVYLVACLVDEMAKLTKLISNNVCYGITLKLSESEVIFLQVSENAKAIKRAYKANPDLSEMMMVCGIKRSGDNG
jgi:hypothetical protein